LLFVFVESVLKLLVGNACVSGKALQNFKSTRAKLSTRVPEFKEYGASSAAAAWDIFCTGEVTKFEAHVVRNYANNKSSLQKDAMVKYSKRLTEATEPSIYKSVVRAIWKAASDAIST
jgi:hypothetical protein